MLQTTLDFLRKVGESGCEGFVLWSGKKRASTFHFLSIVVPEQQAYTTPDGLLVVVAGEALFRVNKEVYQRDEILGGQIHTHPTSAYHSSTDDHYPLVTMVGALSIVIPDFARNAPDDMAYWASYRLADYGSWMPLTAETQVVVE